MKDEKELVAVRAWEKDSRQREQLVHRSFLRGNK